MSLTQPGQPGDNIGDLRLAGAGFADSAQVPPSADPEVEAVELPPELFTGAEIEPDRLKSLMKDVAGQAITQLLERQSPCIVRVGKIATAAFGRRRLVPRSRFSEFLSAVNEDPRTQQREGPTYRIEKPKPEQPDAQEKPVPSSKSSKALNLSSLVDGIAQTLFTESSGRLYERQVLGFVNSFGIHLEGYQINDLMVGLTLHPSIRVGEDGVFSRNEQAGFMPQSDDFDKSPYNAANANGDRSLSPKHIARTVRELEQSPELRDYRRVAKRLAKPSRHHGRKSGQGSIQSTGKRGPKRSQGRKYS